MQGIGLDLVEGGRRSNFCVSVSGGEGRRVGVLRFLLFGKIFKTVFYLKKYCETEICGDKKHLSNDFWW